jgi:copper transport protein
VKRLTMIDAPISRVRLRDLARLGRSGPAAPQTDQLTPRSGRSRGINQLAVTVACLAAALTAPASAWAHAALLRTVPEASRTVNSPPTQVELSYTEPVEPRFAIVSVTDKHGTRVTAGSPRRSPSDPDTLLVPLRRVPEGWYLVYWRVISVDGHPVRGAFTFAVGPNPGPAPQFQIPSISETAATPRLIAIRWVAFLSVMAAIGLFALRIATARPLVRRVPGTELRALTIAFLAAAAVALVAVPVYVVVATADFALRSAFDLGAIVPLLSVSAFGRGYLVLELCFALFVAAALVALWVDRPDRERRSISELLAGAGAWTGAAAVLLVPAVTGHAAQTSPRGLSIALDWLHMVAGSIWVGGLIGLLVLWRSLPVARRVAGLAFCVPRFSATAFVSVLALIGSGIGSSLVHLPTLATLWDTSYGQALLVKIALLAAALLLAAVNLLRTRPRLQACAQRPELGPGTARLLRRLVSGEVALVAAAVLAAALLTSLAPPSKALAQVGRAAAKVGPGPAHTIVRRNGYVLDFRIAPNKAAVPSDFQVAVTRGGRPVGGLDVTMTFLMLDMEMGQQAYRLAETAPGVYSHSAPALVMVGHWGLEYQFAPPQQQPFDVLILDRATG